MSNGIHNHPFYRPLWRRVALVATTVLWAGFEVFYTRDGFWTVLAIAVMAYCIWTFLLRWDASSGSDA